MYECINCDAKQVESRFDADLIEAADVWSIEEINTPPGAEMETASEDFGGDSSKLCAKCWWECAQAAYEIAAGGDAECSACGVTYWTSTFDDDLVVLAEVQSIEQINQPPGSELDDAVTNSGGRAGSMCPKCWWDAMCAAWELVAADVEEE